MDFVFQLAAGDFAPPPVVKTSVQLGEGSVELALVCLSAMLADKAFDPLLGHEGLFVWSINNGRVNQVASGQLLEERAA